MIWLCTTSNRSMRPFISSQFPVKSMCHRMGCDDAAEVNEIPLNAILMSHDQAAVLMPLVKP